MNFDASSCGTEPQKIPTPSTTSPPTASFPHFAGSPSSVHFLRLAASVLIGRMYVLQVPLDPGAQLPLRLVALLALGGVGR
jgi:hypothetical protein